MESLVLEHADRIRELALFASIPCISIAELLLPRRALVYGTVVRWLGNLGLGVANGVLGRWLLPAGSVGAALLAQREGWGLLSELALPPPGALALAVLGLDLGQYLLHRIMHAVPPLWRLHRVHHADLDVDFTTALRHHPLETLATAVLSLALVIGLGAPPAAVVLYEALRLAGDVFNHANLRISGRVDGALRRLLVTPDMHRVHHSARVCETNSNYGTLLPWWDHLLGTYREGPEGGHQAMTLGLECFRNAGDLQLQRMLVQPFLRESRSSTRPGVGV